MLDGRIAGKHAIAGDSVTIPGRSLCAHVEQHGLKTIHRGRKFGLRGDLLFKLLPQGAHLIALIIRQQPKNPVRGSSLPLVLIRHADRVVRKRVARIDLHQIMDDQHLQHPQDIQTGIRRMLRKHHGNQAQMPRVFGIILRTSATDQLRLTKNLLQFVDFDNEANLPDQP